VTRYRGRLGPPAGLGVRTCPVCWYRMDPVIAAQGWDRHPWCTGWPDGSRVQSYGLFESSVHERRRPRGSPAGAVESGEKTEPPSSSLGGSAGHREQTVTSAPETQSKASPVESPNRRENAP